MKSTFVRKASLGIFLALSLSPSTHAREMIEVIEEQAQKVPLSVAHTLKLPLHFFQKLTYSQRSLTNFLEEVYNHKRYAQDFLALNFLHPLSGLELASNSKHPRQFACKILRLLILNFTISSLIPMQSQYSLNKACHFLLLLVTSSKNEPILLRQ